jgi:AcrR family transcriptional regulator
VEEAGDGLPASILAAWGVRERPARGPKPALSLERIVEAAIGIASSDGLAAVSMSRVAADLGVTTMALYRYVGAKNELLRLVSDAVYGPPPVPPPPGEGWREGLTRWAEAEREVLRRHPWVLHIPVEGSPVTPNAIGWLEVGLACLRDTGLDPGERLGTILLLTGYVRSVSLLAADLADAQARGQAVGKAWPELLGEVSDAERFPYLWEVLSSVPIEESDDLDEDFRFGLERVLDGIAALVRTRE